MNSKPEKTFKLVYAQNFVYIASNTRSLKIGVSGNVLPRIAALNSRYVNKNKPFTLLDSFKPLLHSRIVENFLFDICHYFREVGEFYQMDNVVLNAFDWVKYHTSIKSTMKDVDTFDLESPSYCVQEGKTSLDVIKNVRDSFHDANYPHEIELSKRTLELCKRYPLIGNWNK